MDLERRGRRLSANRVLNRYLWRAPSDLDLEGLAAMPLCLGLRAGVRALVAADKLRHAGSDADAGKRAEAQECIAAALRFLDPAGPRMVAVGGLSGTGKSTLAAALAADIGPSPGAVHLRSDVERKAMLGVEETHRLGPEAYTAEAQGARLRGIVSQSAAGSGRRAWRGDRCGVCACARARGCRGDGG